MKPKNRIFCPAIGRSKMLFETSEKAERFIKFNEDDIKKNGNVKFEHLRPYYCQVCGGWHITHASLSKKEQEKRDKKVDDIITIATEEAKKRNQTKTTTIQDAYDFIKGFDLKEFGGRKKFRKYLMANPDLIPPGLDQCKIFSVIKEMPIEYFTGQREFKDIPELSDAEVFQRAQELYSTLPLWKLKTPRMIEEYIKWELKYKQEIPLEVIEKLRELCGL